MVDLDVIDQAILYHLQQDGRRPITEIADAVDVSDNTVRNRIQAMEDSGVITGYQVSVDYDEADVQNHYLFVCSARISDRERLAAKARTFDGVTEVISLMTGSYNVYIVAIRESKDATTDLAVALEEAGLTIEREHLIRDHTRRPYSGFQPPEYVSRN
jgi:DNA-binding Lrp family transcriptional regulator